MTRTRPDGLWVVAGAGPRSLQTADRATCARAVAAAQDAVTDLHTRHGDRLVIMSGMAEGWDHLIAWAALRHNIRLWAAIPHRGYGAHYWGRHSLTGLDRLDEFTRIINSAWRRTFVMDEIHRTDAIQHDGKHANLLRNEWMISQACEVLAWQASSPSSGTAHCVRAARAAGVPVRDASQPAPEPLFTI